MGFVVTLVADHMVSDRSLLLSRSCLGGGHLVAVVRGRVGQIGSLDGPALWTRLAIAVLAVSLLECERVGFMWPSY